MKRVLVTGGSHAEMPIIEAAKKDGWYVITTGNNIDGIGHTIADEFVPGDFSDKDFVYELAKKHNVDAMISGCNDFAYISTAYACEKLGLPGHDTYENAQIIHHKNEFRAMTESIGIRTPKCIRCLSYDDVEAAVDTIGFPVVVKPVDLTGGKGVQICGSLDEVRDAYNEALEWTREPLVILEECIVGSNHGTTMLIKDEKVVWSFFDNEQYYLNKYLVEGACSPSDIPQHAMYTLINDVEKIAQHLHLVDGLFHTQFILEKGDNPVIIDPCRRAPGDLYILLAKYVTGVDYPMEIMKAFTGQGLQDRYINEHRFVARECIMTNRCGRIKDIVVSQDVEDRIVYRLMFSKSGDVVDDPMKFKAGILIMEFANYDEMQHVLRDFHEKVYIEFE